MNINGKEGAMPDPSDRAVESTHTTEVKVRATDGRDAYTIRADEEGIVIRWSGFKPRPVSKDALREAMRALGVIA